MEVVSILVDFSHVADTFTAVSTEESSVMVQIKVTFVPLIVGCIVVTTTVGDGTENKGERFDQTHNLLHTYMTSKQMADKVVIKTLVILLWCV